MGVFMSVFRPRILGPLAAATFVGTWSITFLAPILPEVADGVDVSVTAAGQLLTVSAAFTVLALIALGPLSDRYGRKVMLTAGLTIMALASFGAAATSNYSVLMALRILAGVADALVMPVAIAAVADYFTEKDRQVAVNIMIIPAGASAVIGLPLVVIVAALADWHASFLMLGIALAATALFAQTLPPAAQRPHRVPLREHYRASYSEVLSSRAARLVLLASVLSASVWYGVITYAGVFFEEELGAGPTMLSILFAGLGVAYIIGGGFGVLAARRMSPRSIAVTSTVMAAVLLIPTFTSAPLVPVSIALALAFAASRGPAIAALVNMLLELTPDASGTAISAYAVVAAMGLLIGAAVGGAAIAALGFTGMAVAFTFLAAASTAVLLTPAEAPARDEAPS